MSRTGPFFVLEQVTYQLHTNIDIFLNRVSNFTSNAMSGSKMAGRQAQSKCGSMRTVRTFTSSSSSCSEAAQEVSFVPRFDPLTVTHPRGERALMRSGIFPVGSRRRRAALKTSDNIPFEQLPYQCFQEARKVLEADRKEKIEAIEKERERITRLNERDPSTIKGGETQKRNRLESMRSHLEHLKILADINDPLIKKRFEDGEGM
jgi:large subunit ribosomal protein L35